MKFIRTGLTANHTSLLHKDIYVIGTMPLHVSGYQLNSSELAKWQLKDPVFSVDIVKPFAINASSGFLAISETLKQGHQKASLLVMAPKQGQIVLASDELGRNQRTYTGSLMVIADGNSIRVVLQCPVEDYVISVLKGEVPAKYHLEAIKAQAVSARTYALHPRVDHSEDFCDVCDSYLCCQAFSGHLQNIEPAYIQASEETSGQVLVYKDKPVLALFSSCAGGHTENYQDCFSDWTTGKFPPDPLPYLKGISESTQIDNSIIDAMKLKQLWDNKNISTYDSWSPNFRWSIKFSAQELESVFHHRIAELLKQKDMAHFIKPPPSMIVGNIQNFSINTRGVGGTAVELAIATSKGTWHIRKELTIRNLFKNPVANIQRLPSAKIVFNQIRNSKKQLRSIVIYGLGHGHGVGLQQVGAQGMAKLTKNYKEILFHYYFGVNIETV